MKASANQADRLSHAQVLIKRVTVATLRGPKTSPRFFNVSVAISIAAMIVLGIVYFLGFKAALLIGLVAGLVIMTTGLALDRRWVNQNAQGDDEPDVTDLPTAMPPADCKPGEIGFMVPSSDTDATLVLAARMPCSVLMDAVISVDEKEERLAAIVKTQRIPSGIKYKATLVSVNREANLITLSLRPFKNDCFGKRYHTLLRRDLLHKSSSPVDVELCQKESAALTLKDLSVYKSA